MKCIINGCEKDSDSHGMCQMHNIGYNDHIQKNIRT
jgi:hypothetical protein